MLIKQTSLFSSCCSEYQIQIQRRGPVLQIKASEWSCHQQFDPEGLTGFFMSSSRCVCCDQNAGSSWDMLMSQMWVSARSDTVNWTHYHSCDTDLHFNEGCRGGGESVQSRQTHTRSQTHAMREGWNLKHTSALPNICNILVKSDVPTSHLSLQLRFCRSHRCC